MFAPKVVLLLASGLFVAVRCATPVGATTYSAAATACTVPDNLTFVDCSTAIDGFLHGDNHMQQLPSRRHSYTSRSAIELSGQCRGRTSSHGRTGEQQVIRRVAATAEFYRDVYNFIDSVDMKGRDSDRWVDAYRSLITGIPPEYAYRMPFEQVKSLDTLQRTAMLQRLPLDEIKSYERTVVGSVQACGPLMISLVQEHLIAITSGAQLLRDCVSVAGDTSM